jgi:phosphoglycerate dehydrogenase-like enzyme
VTFAVSVMDEGLFEQLFDRDDLRAIVSLEHEYAPAELLTPAGLASLARTEVLVTCWGAPPLDRVVLEAAPRLRAVVHAAGTVREIVTEASWARGIEVSSAAWANALPVAEYTLAAILASNKRVWELRDRYRELRSEWDRRLLPAGMGNHDRRIGIVGASHVGRRVIELLRPLAFEILVADPYLSPPDAAALGVRLVELDELCRTCDIVSLHAPDIPATRHLIDAGCLASLRDGATLINTARGALVDGDALSAELGSGRINAVIDTTDPEPLPDDSPLYELPNVILTPHIAGAAGNEMRLLGDAARDELARFARGERFEHPVVRGDLERIA